ncbi:oplophorus-luciferin 2-monooxygenase non-catalytic subunit-like isoform X1 [Palaemon carinicauda]|uniref:oplophorus-luciferin 2-monooxygenase non-catalytic subunit-like isoform X1 n=1 Tax=Palaemon carinicauda TaxID=392227 RepID=UPI0035B62B4F
MFKLVVVTFVCIQVAVESKAQRICPDPSIIDPCICYKEGDDLFLDCSQVMSELQLGQILGQPLPSYDFKEFTILHNWNLRTIPAGVFGSLTFEEVQLKGGNIELIEPGALLGSVQTLKKLKVLNQELFSFPFEEVELFRQLGSLKFDYNKLETLPPLKSSHFV